MYATPSPEASVGLGASFRPQNNERLSCGSHTKWNINTGCWELIILSTRVTQRCRCDAADYWHVHFQRNTRIRSCSSCLIIRYGPMPRRPGTPAHRLGICLCSTCLRMGFYAALGRVSTLPCCLPNGWVGGGRSFRFIVSAHGWGQRLQSRPRSCSSILSNRHTNTSCREYQQSRLVLLQWTYVCAMLPRFGAALGCT